METRLPLAAPTDLAAIEGRVFADLTGDGFTPGEEISGATIDLFRDNGDGILDAAVDELVASVTSGADGLYRFDELTAGDYLVRQPAQNVAGISLSESVSPPITIAADDVVGELFIVIDSFNAAPQLVFDSTNDGIPVTSSVDGPTSEIIGGSRDLFVNKTSVNGRVQISVNDPDFPGVLSFDSIQTGQGQRIISWDGPDGDALSLDDTGLGAIDLTDGGLATGLRLEAGADSAEGTVTIRIYSDDGNPDTATRFSTGVLAIPDTGGAPISLEFLSFDSFVASGGGGADFTQVGAIEMEITGAPNVNGAANLVGAIGPTVRGFDFDNFAVADLRLAMAVDEAAPGVGQNVTFSVTVNNDGPDTASGVAARTTLPSGLSFVSASASQGDFDSDSGTWLIGSVPNGEEATLSIVATVTQFGSLTSTSEIIASDQFDPDSTPDNDVPDEDDQDSVTIVSELADLSLTQSVDVATPALGDEVSFTVTVLNAGPSVATGVRVGVPLPMGLTLVEQNPGQGNVEDDVWVVGELPVEGSASLVTIARVEAVGDLTRTAEVTAADQPDPNSTPGNNDPDEDDQASVTLTVTPPMADLSLTNTVDNDTPNVGETIRFRIVVSNAGPDIATGVVASSLLPSGLAFVSSTLTQGDYEAATGVWQIGSINPGNDVTLDLFAEVETAAPQSLRAEVIESDQADPNSTPGNQVEAEDDQETVVVTPQVSDLSLEMTSDVSRPIVGQQVTFTLTLNNDGPDQATTIAVRNSLPTGLSLVSADASVGEFSPATSLWSLASLAAGSSATLQIVTRYDEAIVIQNTAEVVAVDQFDPDSTPDNNVPGEDDQATVVLEPATADLSLSKSVSEAAPNLGESVTFTITVANAGPDAATGVSVLDRLPPELAFVSATQSIGEYVAATGVWTIGGIAADGEATLQVIATPTAAGTLTNTAEVLTADQFDPNSTPGNAAPDEDDFDSVIVTPQLIDLSLAKTINNSSPNVGQNVTYVLTLANAGPSTATGIVVRDLLNDGVEFVSATATSGSYSVDTGLWTPNALAAGTSARLTIIATVIEVGSFTNVAEVMAADQPDINSTPGNSNPDEDDYATVTFVTPVADLSLTKTVDNATPDRDELITFTVVITNSGPDDATGIVVTNRIPRDFDFAGSTVTAGNFIPTAGTWSIPALANGESETLTIRGRVTDLSPLTSTAEITQADQSDPDSTPGNADPDEDDFASVVVTPNVIDLVVSGEIDNEAPLVGDVVTITFDVKNLGPATATGIELMARLPRNVSVIESGSTLGVYDPVTGLWTLGTLAPEQTETLTLQLRVDAAGIKLVTLQVTAADQFDSSSTPDNDVEEENDQISVIINAPRILSKRLFIFR